MSSYITRKSPGDTSWFKQDRFGVFIHWGLYALPARHEWIKNIECIPEDVYQRYFEYFDPDMYDPKQWAAYAKAAGMKYAVFTSKHHEGFCMWDTKFSEYKCTNTPAKRDLLKEYVDAFRNEGIRVGFYYSVIDWHHPDFTIDLLHPRRNDPDAEKLNEGRDMKRYAQYMRDQVTELLTNYGKIDILWYDFSYPDRGNDRFPKGKGKDDWESEELIELTRKLQPGIIIDNRADIEQDLFTPEQFQPTEWVKHKETGELVTWEACQTFSGSWGYHRDESTWKSPEMLIRMLVNTVSLGGNLLMNVGPTARGYLDKRAIDALAVYAEWMKYNSRSIYECTMAEPDILPSLPPDCRFTQSVDGKRLYLHLYAWPFIHIQLPGLAGRVAYVQFLHDGSEILFTEGKMEHFGEGLPEENSMLVLKIPVIKPDVTVPVIEIFLK
jgi:alpha-L-fucosidase